MDRNELFALAARKYGARPEYLWSDDPYSAVLRHGDNGKWFAIVMRIPKNRLGLDSPELSDVVNFKCDPLLMGSVRMHAGVFPAYHMNKEHWVSVLLDSCGDDGFVQSLAEMSYALTSKGKSAGKRKKG